MAPADQTPRIAIVDDDPDDVALMRRLLEELPVDVDDYPTAEQLLEAVHMAAHPPRYRSLVVDVLLPVMDGYELVRRYLTTVPGASVIVVSGVPDEHEARLEALRAGAVAYLPKRLMAERLIPTVSQVLAIGSSP